MNKLDLINNYFGLLFNQQLQSEVLSNLQKDINNINYSHLATINYSENSINKINNENYSKREELNKNLEEYNTQLAKLNTEYDKELAEYKSFKKVLPLALPILFSSIALIILGITKDNNNFIIIGSVVGFISFFVIFPSKDKLEELETEINKYNILKNECEQSIKKLDSQFVQNMIDSNNYLIKNYEEEQNSYKRFKTQSELMLNKFNIIINTTTLAIQKYKNIIDDNNLSNEVVNILQHNDINDYCKQLGLGLNAYNILKNINDNIIKSIDVYNKTHSSNGYIFTRNDNYKVITVEDFILYENTLKELY